MRTYSIKLAEEVLNRDQWCIICGNPHNLTLAHVENKGMGGKKEKDTAKDLVVLCAWCHDEMDNGSGKHSKEYRQICRDYINSL